MKKTIDDIIDVIYKEHERYGIYPDVYKCDGCVCVEIERGHRDREHGTSEEIMENIGAHEVRAYCTGADKRGYYSAMRYYEFTRYESVKGWVLRGKNRRQKSRKAA